jgi:hypothetical protein
MAVLIAVVVWAFTPPGATNFDRIVLGEGNFGSDPNATADITLQNDEYISNSSDDTVSISGVLSTNNITAAYLTATGLNLDSGVTVGQDVFTTTAETDTVVIPGASTADMYFITGNFTSAIDQQDILQWEALSGKLVVHRMAAGESALKYSWLRIRPY